MKAAVKRTVSSGVTAMESTNQNFSERIDFEDQTHQDSSHRGLANWNRTRLSPSHPSPNWEEELALEHFMRTQEGFWIEALRSCIGKEAAAAPDDPDGFVEWFKELQSSGPGQSDPLFDWLAEKADRVSMEWFLTQEVAGESGFDDLVALTQLKLPVEPKLELARNYWDEMGRGRMEGMHGFMLSRTVSILGLKPTNETVLWEPLALANTLIGLAASRRYTWQSVGALGVIELTAPQRVGKIAIGLKRLGYDRAARQYFDLHAVLDIKHAEDWINNIFRPLLRDQPDCCSAMAEGALMRLHIGSLCYLAYRAHLW
jgi:hypothetical protein